MQKPLLKYYKNNWDRGTVYPHEIYRVHPDGTFDYMPLEIGDDKNWYHIRDQFSKFKDDYKAVEITEQEAFIEIL